MKIYRKIVNIKMNSCFSLYVDNVDAYINNKHTPLKNLIETDLVFESSTVGSEGTNYNNEGIRKSNKVNLQHEIYSSDLSRMFRKLFPLSNEAPVYIKDLELIKYITGDFFKKHIDGKESESHIGTLLIYPPGQIFSGGELIIYNGDKTKTLFNSDHSQQYHIVGLPLGLYHECTPITSGTRYVFKAKIILDDEYLKLLNAKPLEMLSIETDDGDEDNEEEIRDTIAAYKAKISELELKLYNIPNNEYNKSNDEIIEDLKSLNDTNDYLDFNDETGKIRFFHEKTTNQYFGTTCVVILKKPYYCKDTIVNPQILTGNDRLLYNLILTNFPNCNIQIMCTDHKSKNENVDNEIDQYSEYNNFNLEFYKKCAIVYQGCGKHGYITDRVNIYNDYSYNTEYTLKISYIVITKKPPSL